MKPFVQIPTVTLSNPDNNYYWEWECEGGNATQDQVFLLSMEEICKYYQFDSWDNENQSGFCQKLITDVTPYAINKGVACYTFTDSDYEVYYVPEGYTSDIVGKSGAIWWSRTPALNNEYFICVVCEDGFTGYSLEFDVALEKLPGIRPALYIEW